MIRILIALFVSATLASSALAHQPSTAYLRIDAQAPSISGSWDIPLIDLQLALDLDANQDLNISWGEITNAEARLLALANSKINLFVDGNSCDITFQTLLANQVNGDGYLHMPWQSSCPADSPLSVNYQLFSSLDISHRALLNMSSAGDNKSYVIRPSEDSQALGKQGFASYFKEGIIHIWVGYDHLLFLLLLLLPLIVASWRDSVRHSLWLITAFTAAHSLSLIVVTLGNVALPVKLVELCISLSIAAAAGLLVWKPHHRASAAMALGLGLLHGLGFANVLRELLAKDRDVALQLLGFNLGVEAGQIAIAAPIILLLILAHQRFNYTLAVRSIALVSLAIAAYWTLERL
jgi:hypothetical protein